MKFLFYDVETANPKQLGSICAVGWCLVSGMSIVDKGYSLIDPETTFGHYNTLVHGISSASVVGAPTFSEYWHETLRKLMEDCVVVAHNAAFDIRATETALSNAEIHNVSINFFDFLSVSQKLIPECASHKLDALAKWADVSFAHHYAADDARALCEVALSLCKRKAYDSLEEMFIRSQCAMQTFTDIVCKSPIEVDSCVPESNDERPHFSFPKNVRYDGQIEKIDDALFGCVFCITGDVPPYGRDELERMILEHSGVFRDNVSGKTRFLVVGMYDDMPEGYISGKHKKALELIGQGYPIEILSVEQFLSILKSPSHSPMVSAIRTDALKKQEEELEKERLRIEKRKAREEKKQVGAACETKERKSPILGVMQFSESGDLIAEFESVSIASKKSGVNPKSIRDAAKGIQRTAGGYLWKFRLAE